MSLVEIVGADGKTLGKIDEVAGTVTINEEWEKITAAKRKRDKKKKQTEDIENE